VVIALRHRIALFLSAIPWFSFVWFMVLCIIIFCGLEVRSIILALCRQWAYYCYEEEAKGKRGKGAICFLFHFPGSRVPWPRVLLTRLVRGK